MGEYDLISWKDLKISRGFFKKEKILFMDSNFG